MKSIHKVGRLISEQDRANIGENSGLLSFGCRQIKSLVILGNARVAGLQADLGLTDQQYQICVTVLYVCVPALLLFLAQNLTGA